MTATYAESAESKKLVQDLINGTPYCPIATNNLVVALFEYEPSSMGFRR